MAQDPQLLLLAGPNGAGKSTFSKELSKPGAVIFDVDKVIARMEELSPAMAKKKLYEGATQEFFRQATLAVRLKQHFTLETNFRDESLMDIVAQFKRFGYATHMIYLVLESAAQSVFRVNERVKDGGHHVDLKNIQQNYDIGLQYLERFAGEFDGLDILDASGNAFELRWLLNIRSKVLKFESSILPSGAAETISRIAHCFRPPDDPEISPYRGQSR